MATELDEGDLDLIEAIRITRNHVLRRRLEGMVERYPEVETPQTKRLADAEIIRLALTRELAHQNQVLKDMAK